MKRREFIRNGTVASAGLIGMTGCASMGANLPVEERIEGMDIRGYLNEIDAAMAGVEGFQCDSARPNRDSDRLARSAISSLGISSMFRDLPLEVQLHPWMQQRIWAHMDEMETSVFGDSERIIKSGLATDKSVVEAVKSKSNPGLKFLEQFDRDAAAHNISRRKRMRLRSLGMDAIDRMRVQSPQTVLEESFAKVKQMERTVDLCGSVEEADRRVTSMRLGSRAYEKRREEIEEITQYWSRNLIASNDPTFVPSSTDEETSQATQCPECPSCDPAVAEAEKAAYLQGKTDAEKAAEQHYGALMKKEYSKGKKEGLDQGNQRAMETANRVVRAGSWTLGVAGVTVAAGVVLAAVSPILTLIVSGTIGGIILIAGIIVISVGAAQRRRIMNDIAQ